MSEGFLKKVEAGARRALPRRYAFGDFVLEPSQRRLRRVGGETLTLTPRLFNALKLFVENAGDLLDKDTLMRVLWPGLVVEENSLSQVVSGLRRVLADDRVESRYIETVPRRGFRFIAVVTVLPDEDVADVSPATPPHSESPDALAHADRSPVDASATGPAARPERRRLLLWAFAGSAVTAVAGLAWWMPRRASPTVRPSTLAVLPFKSLDANERDELLEVGMADSLITRLSALPGLVVRSIGSVRRYSGAEQDPLRAAHELDVAWIVDGSLQRRRNRLRVTARLLSSADGAAFWTGSFDEEFTGVFEVQDRISARVADVLMRTLAMSADARPALSGLGGTRNFDAYQLYLAAGRQAQDMRADGLQNSIALYRRALQIDPEYALAWAGLAESHRRRLFAADARPSEVFEPAGVAVAHALALVPDLAEGRTEQAFRLYWFDFDWVRAEQEFRRVLMLNPNVAMAHFGLASLLLNQGRIDEGFLQMRAARELDPMSPVLNTLEAAYLLEGGRVGEARKRLDRAFDIAPKFWLAHCTRGLLHWREDQKDSAISDFRTAVLLADTNSRPSALLAIYLARSGRTEEARAILAQLLTRAKSSYLPPSSLAAVYAALGDTRRALDSLESAVESRDTRVTFLKDDPRLIGLRHEPRFVSLVRKLKLDGFSPGLAPL